MRRSRSHLNLFVESLAVLLSLAVLSAVANWWVLDRGNFFGLDDFDWFRQIQVRGDEGFFTWLPTSVYNDRPVGALVLRAIWRQWEWNHVAHHTALWTIHLVNALLVYVVAGNLLRALDRLDERPRFTAWLAAAVFVAWPTSTTAPSWDASVFDLVGATFLVAFLAVAVTWPAHAMTMVRAAVLALLLWLGLRTKEMLIVAPFVLLGIVLAEMIVARWRAARPHFREALLTAAGLCGVSVLYYLLLRLSDTDSYGGDSSHPYFLSFAPSVLLKNAGRYITLFFDFGIPDNGALWPEGTRWLYYIFPAALVVAGLWRAVRGRSVAIALCLVLTLMQLAPVLAMKNMQQRLYLYLPSVFAAIAIAAAVAPVADFFRARRASRIATGAALTAVMLWGAYGSPVWISRNWWLEVGRENLKIFAKVRELPPFPEDARIAVVNVPDWMVSVTILAPGDGEILRVLGSHPSLKVRVYEHDVPAGEPADPPTHILDYNGGDLRLRRRP